MKTLIFGSNGQLGSEVSKKIKGIKISRNIFKNFNFNKEKEIFKILEKFSPRIIINCAAFTDVDNAEKKRNECLQINSKAVKFISKYCNKKKILLIHFSTDYVFNGKKNGFYSETTKTNPINFYGKSKLLGDKFIINSKCKYIIFRISWVYNLNKKNNFIYKINEKINKNIPLLLPIDQIGSPTSVKFITKYLKKTIYLLKKGLIKSGVYNLAGSKPASRYDVGIFLSKILKKKTKINYYEYKNRNLKVKRPLNSKLNISKIEKALNIKLIDWKKDLRENLK